MVQPRVHNIVHSISFSALYESLTASGDELPGDAEGDQPHADRHAPLLEDQQIPCAAHKEHILDMEKHFVSCIRCFHLHTKL